MTQLVSGTGVISVVVADDNAVVRLGIRSLLGTAADINVVAEVADGVAAATAVRNRRPDVLLLDVRMPRQDGVTTATEVAELTNVVMLTYSDAPEVVGGAIQAGAKGYLVHGHFSADELIGAVRMAASGHGTFSGPALVALRTPVTTTSQRAAQFGLSERETEVMDLIAEGASNAEIALKLFISEKTVKNHINRIFAKLDVTSRSRAVSLWLTP
ncbi:LuxR C-terminal-related transcriptional regulator [Microlunatus elymi]|uniref:LuxR C-terminal-related transcriptional regulator n=1 Tax=Microlunatus elymi TaxID=2596828 RepID=UPI001AF00FAA|nr:response regulator transcription factor [Microlunatus elymi]